MYQKRPAYKWFYDHVHSREYDFLLGFLLLFEFGVQGQAGVAQRPVVGRVGVGRGGSRADGGGGRCAR